MPIWVATILDCPSIWRGILASRSVGLCGDRRSSARSLSTDTLGSHALRRSDGLVPLVVIRREFAVSRSHRASCSVDCPSSPSRPRRVHGPRRISVVTGLLVAASALTAASGTAAAASTTAHDRSLASQINMRRSDLPAGAQWVSSPSTPNTPAEIATARRGVACIQRAVGHGVSADPFGLGGGPAGDVTADVSSPTFALKGPSQLPSTSSEVVMTTTSSQAGADLHALTTPSALVCAKAVFEALLAAGHLPAGTKLSVQLLTPPAMPSAGPGGGFRVSISGPSFGDIIDEACFYAVGRAELALDFTAVDKTFRSDWARSISGKVVARAVTILGS